MESIERILLEQDVVTVKFNKIFQQALHPPNPRAVRDESWGRSSINVTVMLDEFDPAMLTRLLPELTAIHREFAESRNKERLVRDAVIDAMPDPSLNLENRPRDRY